MSSFCSISLTMWPSSSLFHIQKWSQNCLFHKSVPLSNKALPPRKCCPHLSIRFLHSVLSIHLLGSGSSWEYHITPNRPGRLSGCQRQPYCLCPYPTLFTQWFPLHIHWKSRLDPVITFSLWSLEQITSWAKIWSSSFLGTLNIYWAIILASCLPFLFLFLFLPVPFPIFRGSPTLSLTFPCPMMIQWWLLTDERHTHEKECIFMRRMFQNGRGIVPGVGNVGDIQISE